MTKPHLVVEETIINKIHLLRSQKVMLDHDLAALYGVETRVFNQAVKRNINRFPKDFMFQLRPSTVTQETYRFQTRRSKIKIK